MFDLIITAGTAVLPSGTEPADIGISGGKLAAVGGPGSLAPIGAIRVIDAAGQIVMRIAIALRTRLRYNYLWRVRDMHIGDGFVFALTGGCEGVLMPVFFQ